MATQLTQQTVFQTVLQIGQGPAGAPPKNNLDTIVYDGLGRVTSYNLNGTPYTVNYVSATQILREGGGSLETITLDTEGRIQSIVVT